MQTLNSYQLIQNMMKVGMSEKDAIRFVSTLEQRFASKDSLETSIDNRLKSLKLHVNTQFQDTSIELVRLESRLLIKMAAMIVTTITVALGVAQMLF